MQQGCAWRRSVLLCAAHDRQLFLGAAADLWKMRRAAPQEDEMSSTVYTLTPCSHLTFCSPSFLPALCALPAKRLPLSVLRPTRNARQSAVCCKPRQGKCSVRREGCMTTKVFRRSPKTSFHLLASSATAHFRPTGHFAGCHGCQHERCRASRCQHRSIPCPDQQGNVSSQA